MLILLVTALFCSCATFSPEIKDTDSKSYDEMYSAVTVIVTRDFGKEIILERRTELKDNTSAMDLLKLSANVETRFGGGFISSINGVSSEYGGANSKTKDWFFYINGIASNVGAGDYILKEGDTEQWDFHDWSYQQFVPAIISSYPQPFLSGFKPETRSTLIVFEAPFQNDAKSLEENLNLAGVSQVSVISFDELSKKSLEQNNLIIVASLQNSLISELNNKHKKLGFYTYSDSGKVVVMDGDGNQSNEYSINCGLIQATQNPWNPKGIGAGESVVWMITGTDVNGVRNASDVLINKRNILGYTFAFVVNEGTIVKIP